MRKFDVGADRNRKEGILWCTICEDMQLIESEFPAAVNCSSMFNFNALNDTIWLNKQLQGTFTGTVTQLKRINSLSEISHHR